MANKPKRKTPSGAKQPKRAKAGKAPSVSPLIPRLEGNNGLPDKALSALGFASVFQIATLPRAAFLAQLQGSGIPSAKAVGSYELACGYASQLARIFRDQRHLRSGAPKDGKPSWESLFNEDWFTFCDKNHLDSNQGPVAYLCELYHWAGQLEKNSGMLKLDERRPDLKDLVLDWNNTYQSFPMLEQVNDMFSSLIIHHDKKINNQDEVNRRLASARSPMPLPYDLPAHQVELALKDKNLDYATVCRWLGGSYPPWQREKKAEDHLALNVPVGSALRRWFGELGKGGTADTTASVVSKESGLGLEQLMELMRLEGENSYDVVVSGNVKSNSNSNSSMRPHPGHYGATYINGYANSVDYVFTLVRDKKAVRSKDEKGVPVFRVKESGDRMDWVHRFIRLHRAFADMPGRHLDSILHMASRFNADGDANKITQKSLRAVGVLHLFTSCGCPVEAEVFPHWLRKDDTLPMCFGLNSEPALIDRIFNPDPNLPPLQFNHPGKKFDPWLEKKADGASADDAFQENQWVCARLCEGLKVDRETLKALTFFISEKATPFAHEKPAAVPLTVGNVSRLYALTTLAHSLAVPARALIALLQLLSPVHQSALRDPVIDDFTAGRNSVRDTLDVLADLASLSHWLQSAALPVEQVLHWLTPGDALPLSATDSQIKMMVSGIRTHIKPFLVTLDALKARGLPEKDQENKIITDAKWHAELMSKLQYSPEIEPVDAALIDHGILQSPADPQTYFAKAWKTAFAKLKVKPEVQQKPFVDFTLDAHRGQQGAVYQALMSWLSGGREDMAALCAWRFGHDPVSGFGRFIYRSATGDVDALGDAYLADLYDLLRYKSVAGHFNLSGYALGMLAAGRFVPLASGPPPLDITLLYHLSRYVHLLGAVSGNEESLWRGLAGGLAEDAAWAKHLAGLLDWSAAEIGGVLEAFPEQAAERCLSTVERVFRYREMSDKLGLNVRQLLQMRALKHNSPYAQWKPVGEALAATLTQ